MDEYSDETRYTLTFDSGGYTHEVKVDAWITADVLGVAISARHGSAILTHNFNGAQARYRGGLKLWSDNYITETLN